MTARKSKNANALRFINCYNQIEQALKSQNNLKPNLSYTETIRMASRNNAIVRKYEDDLIDYGRLRNSIVHSSNDADVIANPNDEVVEKYEHITALVCTPPLAINTGCVKEVQCVEAATSLKEVLVMMYKSGFSNYPVYHKGMLMGVANAARLTRLVGQKLYNKEDISKIYDEPIGNLVKNTMHENFYTIVDKKITLDKVLNLFAENRQLFMVLITEKGTLVEIPIGIITVADILEINKVLDSYD